MRWAAVSILAPLAACRDYHLSEQKDRSSAEDTAGAFDPEVDSGADSDLGDTAVDLAAFVETDLSANASINVILQYTSFGNDSQSCVFDVGPSR